MKSVTKVKNMLVVSGLMIFLVAWGLCASLQAAEMNAMERLLFEHINAARQNPLDVAASLGMDAEKIKAAFPELAEIFENGLPLLNADEALARSAAAHTMDMIENDYVAYASQDGRTCLNRMAEAGYDAEAGGETLGVLAFVNFIGPVEAADLVFRDIYMDELTPGVVQKRHILSPDFEDVGIGSGTGLMTINGGRHNAYVVTLDFGRSAEAEPSYSFDDMEQALLTLINQARIRPLETLADLGADPDRAAADLPDFENILTQGLPPLGREALLDQAANSHVRQMLEDQRFGYSSTDGSDIFARIAESGYAAAAADELIGRYFVAAAGSEMEAVEYIFEKLFTAELGSDAFESPRILNPAFKEVGVSFDYGYLDLGMGVDLRAAYVVSVIFAGPAVDEEKYAITGFVYTDADMDAIYDAGEGEAGVGVDLGECASDGACYPIASGVTDAAGSFDFADGVTGVYMLTVRFQDAWENYWFSVEKSNKVLEVRIEAGTEEIVIFSY